MTCFLDVQGFCLRRNFVMKEIALVGSKGRIYHAWTLQPPCSFEQLSIEDRVAVKRTSNFKLGLAWEDGTVPYKSLETVFIHIAREFKTWVVEDQNVKEYIYPYKSRSVQIQVMPKTSHGTGDDDSIAKHAIIPEIRCLYDHPQCAVQNATRLYNICLFSKNKE